MINSLRWLFFFAFLSLVIIISYFIIIVLILIPSLEFILNFSGYQALYRQAAAGQRRCSQTHPLRSVELHKSCSRSPKVVIFMLLIWRQTSGMMTKFPSLSATISKYYTESCSKVVFTPVYRLSNPTSRSLIFSPSTSLLTQLISLNFSPVMVKSSANK